MANIKCPNCGSTDTARILYGYPVESEELRKDLEDKKVHLGGCVIEDETIDRHCNICDTDFRSK